MKKPKHFFHALHDTRRHSMIWKNPFISKNSEQQMSEEQYLSLFDGTVLQMIDPQNLEKVSYVSSSPGAGKTSLFRAFSAPILSKIVTDDAIEKNKEIKKQFDRLGIIGNGQVLLNSAIISCARGYSIIDEMFQNGRRKQVFLALINYRIAIALMKSIGKLLDIEPEEYERIHFAQIPIEMLSNENVLQDGKALYKWACKGEKDLCHYLDSERNETIDISFVHTTLLVLKLFEPSNIIIDGHELFHHTLIIFDDFHKLSDNQKKQMVEAIYTLKTNVGIWFGQRLEGVDNEHLISMDGSLSREYSPNVVIDNYWPDNSRKFYSMLGQIADKRIKEANLEGYNAFSDCISDQDSKTKEYKEKLSAFFTQERNNIEKSTETKNKYEHVLAFLDNNEKLDLLEKAIWIQCIIIQQNRANTGQLEMYLGEKTSASEFMTFVAEKRSVAKYYICQKYKLPYYFGYDNLKILSSYNVEQFLYFAGTYFDCCRLKSNGNRKKKSLLAEEQEKALFKAVENKWNDMKYRYSNVDEIRGFLDAIAKLCIHSRDAERAAYAGGAYTGIAIDKERLNRGLNEKKYDKLKTKLGACLSSKYLERREISNGGLVIFYFNRWLCVHYGLPLAYGGWKKISVANLNQIDSDGFDAADMSFQTEMEF